MTSMNQILCLVICGFLFFMMTDALLCQRCMSMQPGKPCTPRVVCSVHPRKQTCYARKTYLDGILQQKILGCKLKKIASCGRVQGAAGIGVHTEHICCQKSDFCNSYV